MLGALHFPVTTHKPILHAINATSILLGKMSEEEDRAEAALDNELAAMLREWDLEDAANPLARHGWKSASRHKHFKIDQRIHELSLPSESLLLSIPFNISVKTHAGDSFVFEAMPSDTVDDLKMKFCRK